MKTKTKKIKNKGIELEIIENISDQPQPALPLEEWLSAVKTPSIKAAWLYKQAEIEEMKQDWNRSVLWGKDKLKESIDSITLLNNQMRSEIDKLKGENLQLRKELNQG